MILQPRFASDDEVRVIRNIRNDGTYPGQPTGALLVRRGCVGYVRHVGVFLQDQLIYTVPFVIYACFRYLYLLHRETGGGDPSRELIRDPHIVVAGLGWLLMTLLLVAR